MAGHINIYCNKAILDHNLFNTKEIVEFVKLTMVKSFKDLSKLKFYSKLILNEKVSGQQLNPSVYLDVNQPGEGNAKYVFSISGINVIVEGENRSGDFLTEVHTDANGEVISIYLVA